MTKNTRAFTVIDMLMIIAVLALAAAILLPWLARPRRSSGLNCTNQLKQVGLAFKTWAIDNNDFFPMEVSQTNGGTMEFKFSEVPWRHFQAMSNELSTPRILVCPNDSFRTHATNFTSDFNNSRLSYFVNLDAKEGGANVVLSGDRNLSISGRASRGLIMLKTNSTVSWTAAIHQNMGNILMTDGSVSQVSSTELRTALGDLSEDGARLSIP